MIESKFTPNELAKLSKEHSKEKNLKMESLLTDGDPESMDDAVRRAVREYVKTRL
jgi:hypothetical protein